LFDVRNWNPRRQAKRPITMKSTVIIGCDNLGCGLREDEADDGGEFTAWIINGSLVEMRNTVEGNYEAYDQKSYNEQGS
jgi:hypothetical protein